MPHTLPRSQRIRRLFTGLAGAALFLASHLLHAQAFDPATVDWEKLSKIPMQDSFISQFNKDCAGCHGEDLRGLTLGPPLVGVELRHGDSVEAIAAVIRDGIPDTEMPAWGETLSDNKIWNMALYVAEQRQGTTILDKNDTIELVMPEGIVKTEKQAFTVDVIAEGIADMPFSIAPLPNGRILVTERMQGLRIVEPDGTVSEPIVGTPAVYADSGTFLGQVQGHGWIYIHHTDRCTDCNDVSRRSGGPVSLNRVVRGRIEGNAWVDEQVIWEADKRWYSNTSDLAAGGRLTFDDQNRLYISVGMKDTLDILGIQDMSTPYGKIHRVNDDGSIPADNPFMKTDGAMPSIYTLGHRSIQGLEFDAATGTLWETEMGPRGGDELNLLVAGGNYGWPVYTNGVNYTGRPIKISPKMGIELAEEDAIFPVVDWTPAIAIDSFIVYHGDEFPAWEGNIIAGTLRATDLLRMEVRDGTVVHTEILLENLARFRDIEQGPDGTLYLLLENKAGSKIVRLRAN